MKSPKKFFILGFIFLIISILFTFSLKKIDVSTPERPCFGDVCNPPHTLPICAFGEKEIGFSKLNKTVFETIGVNLKLYKLTELLGLVPILFAGIYGIVGLTQWIKRKSLKKVDSGLFALGGLFIVAAGIYVLFEKLALNLRPICLDGVLEASYPSSHTVLALCFCLGIILLNLTFYSEQKITKIANFFLAFLAAFILAGRFFSGAHWATDILGGILISISIIFLYYGVLLLLKKSSKAET